MITKFAADYLCEWFTLYRHINAVRTSNKCAVRVENVKKNM